MEPQRELVGLAADRRVEHQQSAGIDMAVSL
jgi:hypothetical protein